MTPPMTPQSLSIADLKAVIDYTQGLSNSIHFKEIRSACRKELFMRISKLHPPTEPKNEEK